MHSRWPVGCRGTAGGGLALRALPRGPALRASTLGLTEQGLFRGSSWGLVLLLPLPSGPPGRVASGVTSVAAITPVAPGAPACPAPAHHLPLHPAPHGQRAWQPRALGCRTTPATPSLSAAVPRPRLFAKLHQPP